MIYSVDGLPVEAVFVPASDGHGPRVELRSLAVVLNGEAPVLAGFEPTVALELANEIITALANQPGAFVDAVQRMHPAPRPQHAGIERMRRGLGVVDGGRS